MCFRAEFLRYCMLPIFKPPLVSTQNQSRIGDEKILRGSYVQQTNAKYSSYIPDTPHSPTNPICRPSKHPTPTTKETEHFILMSGTSSPPR